MGNENSTDNELNNPKLPTGSSPALDGNGGGQEYSSLGPGSALEHGLTARFKITEDPEDLGEGGQGNAQLPKKHDRSSAGRGTRWG